MRYLLFFFIFLATSAYSDINFLTISDIHFDKSIKRSTEGYDTGEQLLRTSLVKFTELTQKVDFVITLGDFPAHSFLYNVHQAENEKVVFHSLYTGINSGWADNHYDALGKNESIFNRCPMTEDLHTCLDHFTSGEICQALTYENYFSAKGKRIEAGVCELTISVHS